MPDAHNLGLSGSANAPKFKLVAKPRRSVRNQGIGGQGLQGMTQCDLCPPAQFAECRECILDNRVLACEWAAVSDAAVIGNGG